MAFFSTGAVRTVVRASAPEGQGSPRPNGLDGVDGSQGQGPEYFRDPDPTSRGRMLIRLAF